MHPFATRSSGASSINLVRLACVKHAASVRPEPGSNSPTKTLSKNPPQQKTHTTKKGECVPNCQRNPHHQKHGTGSNNNWHWHIKNTLLSSQRTTTHQHQPTTAGQHRGNHTNLPDRHRVRQIRYSQLTTAPLVLPNPN